MDPLEVIGIFTCRKTGMFVIGIFVCALSMPAPEANWVQHSMLCVLV